MTFLRRLAKILIYPRTTMREILDGPRDRAVLPLVLLAIFSGYLGDLDRKSIHGASAAPWIAAGVILGLTAVLVAMFYGFAWLVAFAGRRLFEGTGTNAEVRSALAWGSAPIVWALLYRVPAAVLAPKTGKIELDEGLRIDPSHLGQGCLFALLLGLLELVMLVWNLVVASQTVGEAHRFSGWRGLGTIVCVCAVPVIVMIAAFLASR